MGRALSDGSGRRRLGRGAGRSSGKTCWHGGRAGRRLVWLNDGKVLTMDKDDGGELSLGCHSRWLGLGSEPQSMVSRVSPGRWLRRFPRWLKSAATGERRCRVE
jgi:hypothetical protein